MQAEIAVGVELPLVSEYADLVVSSEDDSAIAVLELSGLSDVLLGHAAMPPWLVAVPYNSNVLGMPVPTVSARSASTAICIVQLFQCNQRQVLGRHP